MRDATQPLQNKSSARNGLEDGPAKEVISLIKFACAVTGKKLADLGGVPAVSEEHYWRIEILNTLAPHVFQRGVLERFHPLPVVQLFAV